jgi:hypothetical protein
LEDGIFFGATRLGDRKPASFVPQPRNAIMPDETDKPSAIETIPSVRGGISAIGSANAPLIYFENVPFYGLLNGVGQVTMEAGRLFGAAANGTPIVDRVVVAHLRGNIPAIRNLRAALDGILLMAEPTPEGPTN